jgi:hypothetical protein
MGIVVTVLRDPDQPSFLYVQVGVPDLSLPLSGRENTRVSSVSRRRYKKAVENPLQLELSPRFSLSHHFSPLLYIQPPNAVLTPCVVVLRSKAMGSIQVGLCKFPTQPIRKPPKHDQVLTLSSV